MISVAEAQARLLALASPLPPIERDLMQAVRHYLHAPLMAERMQPAADLSAMDGYAIAVEDFPGPWRVIGESGAGHPFTGDLQRGEAVRIFTGAHVPENADSVLIQENTTRDGEMLRATIDRAPAQGSNIRRLGSDFRVGDAVLPKGAYLDTGAISVAAMAGHGRLTVGGTPRIAIAATGDELVPAGSACSAAQIPCSNSPMLQAMLTSLPCDVRDAGILRDDLGVLERSLSALSKQVDIIVTTGGASVGDHDLVQRALVNIGAQMDFWKVAMRPGKPLMAGKIGNAVVLGLPGNPSSAFVTAFLFLLPLIRHMAGCNAPLPALFEAPTATDLPAGGDRGEYLRATVEGGHITPLSVQDSGVTRTLSQANALLVQQSHVTPRPKGTMVQYMRLS
ncbi:gephyrin-like molybdotransferase Glp [Sphingorhabdus wooponensis]|uniref:Molybdopterin molybdenumtransferase n=1 Tax=Sphingorhabdus wooponensis TaxID=940136 RepID=A0A426RT92_9SPHN|nr:gephyrin-like molybdotransferase Glp [Sphingorhabdus wooponensis]RRQ52230.1 molybdopterin molybdenumtransferase MoeA [Sphingorhabdus wooponensis]